MLKKDPSNIVSIYLAASSHEIMDQEQEVALANKFIELEVVLWVRLLSFEPAIPYIVTALEDVSLSRDDVYSRDGLKNLHSIRTSEEKKRAQYVESFISIVRQHDVGRRWMRCAVSLSQNLPLSETAGYDEYRTKVRAAHQAMLKTKDEFIGKQLRLVIYFANKRRNSNEDFMDLIQEGNMGLSMALEKFDPSHEVKFSTYAANWIKSQFGRFRANYSRTVRFPTHVHQECISFSNSVEKLTGTDGAEPTVEKIAKNLNLSVEKVAHLKGFQAQRSVSIDSETEDGLSLLGLIADEGPLPGKLLEEEQNNERIRDLLSCLNPREVGIICQRFGINTKNNETYTLKEISVGYGVSRERIRQIEEEALKKLRKHAANKGTPNPYE